MFLLLCCFAASLVPLAKCMARMACYNRNNHHLGVRFQRVCVCACVCVRVCVCVCVCWILYIVKSPTASSAAVLSMAHAQRLPPSCGNCGGEWCCKLSGAFDLQQTNWVFTYLQHLLCYCMLSKVHPTSLLCYCMLSKVHPTSLLCYCLLSKVHPTSLLCAQWSMKHNEHKSTQKLPHTHTHTHTNAHTPMHIR
jgi:hypothetical protein